MVRSVSLKPLDMPHFRGTAILAVSYSWHSRPCKKQFRSLTPISLATTFNRRYNGLMRMLCDNEETTLTDSEANFASHIESRMRRKSETRSGERPVQPPATVMAVAWAGRRLSHPTSLSASRFDVSTTSIKVKGDVTGLTASGERYWVYAPPHIETEHGTIDPDALCYSSKYLWAGYEYVTPMAGFYVDPPGASGLGVYGRQDGSNQAGWYYCWNRTYDPSTARWTTPDPATSPWTNLWSYCGANPVTGTDPSGLESEKSKRLAKKQRKLERVARRIKAKNNYGKKDCLANAHWYEITYENCKSKCRKDNVGRKAIQKCVDRCYETWGIEMIVWYTVAREKKQGFTEKQLANYLSLVRNNAEDSNTRDKTCLELFLSVLLRHAHKYAPCVNLVKSKKPTGKQARLCYIHLAANHKAEVFHAETTCRTAGIGKVVVKGKMGDGKMQTDVFPRHLHTDG